MAISDTSMGGSREAFPETAGFSVLTDPALSPEERRSHLNRLFSRYWRPIYAFIRVTRRGTVEDGKDLTQQFFQHILESDLVARYNPKLGRFRHFLKGSLKNFLSKEIRREAAQKRGGDLTLVSLDAGSAIPDEILAGTAKEDADGLFDRQWAEEVVAYSVARLREALVAEGKEAYFKVYEASDLCPPGHERPSYEEIGRPLAISADQVRNFLHAARVRLQELVVRTCSEYAGSPAELKEEIRELFPQ